MGFSVKQIAALRRRVDERFVRTREIHGRELSYLEGWYAVTAANRIFGFDGWSRETVETKCVLARENKGTFIAVYTAKVRITVLADGTQVVREGHGTGEGRGDSLGEVHDTALKAAETDATKRALITFGKPFGLELYRSDLLPTGRTAVRERLAYMPPAQAPSVAQPPPPILDDAKPHPDDGTPIPRPSTHYGLEKFLETREQRGALVREASRKPATNSAPPLQRQQARRPSTRSQTQVELSIDKSALPLPEPKRLRDKSHLKFVASQPCVVCGRQPSDPHHLRFAQPRALGMKVSDEFTVPLCRSHHRNLHDAGNEVRWWASFRIEPLPIARKLWEQTHPAKPQSSVVSEHSRFQQPDAATGDETNPNPMKES